MKKLRFFRTVFALLPPTILMTVMLFGAFQNPATVALAAKSPTPHFGPTSAMVQVSFVNLASPVASPGVQSFILNVIAVRMNPKPEGKNPKVPLEDDPDWQAIPVPVASGISTPAVNQGTFQLDVLAAAGAAQIFNAAGVRPKKYRTIEIVFDVQPGQITPLCSGGAPEGCVAEPIALSSPASSVRFVIPDGGEFAPVKQQLQSLVINLNATITNSPTVTGQPYTVDVSPSLFANNTANPFVAMLSGVVRDAKTKQPHHSHGATITALQAGTDNVVAVSNVRSNNGAYQMPLPVPPQGESFDLVAAGPGISYASTRLPIVPNSSPTQDFFVNGVSEGQITGILSDNCNGHPIPGATIDLLMPLSNPDIDPACATPHCCMTPANCAVVAIANSSGQGGFPQASSPQAPAPFGKVPILPTASKATPTPQPYMLLIKADGYDTTMTTVAPTSGGKGGKCPAPEPTPVGQKTATPTPTPVCNFSLTTSYISGTINLQGPQPNDVQVQVVAEDTGSSHLENTLPAPAVIHAGTTSVPFTLNVPTMITAPDGSPTAGSFDLFASALGEFQGASNPFPGFTVAVQPGVAPTAVPGSTGTPAGCMPTPNVAPTVALTLSCAGHGSISGVISGPDSNTTVELEKGGVQLFSSSPILGPPGPTSVPTSTAFPYSFCAPPDTYDVQRFENSTPFATPTTTSVPVGPMPVPAQTSSPCPSSCNSLQPGCPGPCSPASGPTL